MSDAAAPAVPPGAVPPVPPAAAEAAPPPPSLMDGVRDLLHDLPGLFGDRVELLSLELRRAGLALAQIAILVVAAAILGVTAWLALWAGVTVGLISAGLHWSLALLAVLLVNAGAVALAVVRARNLTELIGLPATRRHLTLKGSGGASR